MDFNRSQFQSAGQLPVYQGGINTGTNWGSNTTFAMEGPAAYGSATNPSSSDSNNLRKRKNRQTDKESASVPSLSSVAALAGTTAAVVGAKNVADKTVSLAKDGASGIGNFIGKATKSVTNGLEDLTIAAKSGGSGILDSLSSGVGAVGSGIGAVGKGIGSAANSVGSGIGAVGKGIGSAWDAIEPSGGLIGDIPETAVKGIGAAAKSDIGVATGRAAMSGYGWVTDRVSDTPGWVVDRIKQTPGWVGNQLSDYYNDHLSPESIDKKNNHPLFPETLVRSLKTVR